MYLFKKCIQKYFQLNKKMNISVTCTESLKSLGSWYSSKQDKSDLEEECFQQSFGHHHNTFPDKCLWLHKSELWFSQSFFIPVFYLSSCSVSMKHKHSCSFPSRIRESPLQCQLREWTWKPPGGRDREATVMTAHLHTHNQSIVQAQNRPVFIVFIEIKAALVQPGSSPQPPSSNK